MHTPPPLPLTPALFQVLLALSDGDKHGYAILKEVEVQTAGEVSMSTGTLYGIIKRLLVEGMIVESRQRPAASEDDARRRYYRLTPVGPPGCGRRGRAHGESADGGA